MMDSLLDRIVALIAGFESFVAHAYPDPGSALYRALAERGQLRAYLAGNRLVPAELAGLSGAPWTIGFGETAGVQEGDVWTRAQAEARLRARAAQFLVRVYRACPQLHLESDARVAACVSLAYNIGIGAFSASSVCRFTRRQDYQRAADAFLLWDKSGGRRMAGLTRRRTIERGLYLELETALARAA